MLCYGLFGRWEMTLLLTRDFHNFAGYFFGYLLDPYVVNLTTAGGPPRSMDIGCTRLTMIARDSYNRFAWRFD
jgi:hypothetical protein